MDFSFRLLMPFLIRNIDTGEMFVKREAGKKRQDNRNVIIPGEILKSWNIFSV